MLWIITKDVLENKPGTLVNAGSKLRRAAWDGAPAEARPIIREEWARLCDTEFRLLDDDGNVCYEGVCHDLDNANQDAAFGPLDSFEDEGCTEMQYRKKGETEWKTL